MDVKKMAMTITLALAIGTSTAFTPTGFFHAPPWLPPLLTAKFYTVPVTNSCDDEVCKLPANNRQDEPASVAADNSPENGHPIEQASVRTDTEAIGLTP
jgi:hypothetical protein